jgi:hypothetical protein
LADELSAKMGEAGSSEARVGFAEWAVEGGCFPPQYVQTKDYLKVLQIVNF